LPFNFNLRHYTKAYAAQAAIAAAALPDAPDVTDGSGGVRRLGWMRRPDVPVLAALLERLCDVPARRGREKLLPLLLEWDMRADALAEGAGTSRGFKSEGQKVGSGAGIEFTVAAVTKVGRCKLKAPETRVEMAWNPFRKGLKPVLTAPDSALVTVI